MFKVGDSVIYPQHGAAVIEGLQDREVGGETREYLVLKLTYGDLTLMVPRDNCQEVGIREVCSSDDVDGVFEILRNGESSTQGNWSRRFKGNIERLQSGDIFQVAEVVRDLTVRDREKGLSAGEKRMLQRSRQILVSELVLACHCDEEKAALLVDEALES
ncbi:MAG: CarD family transcriptional regulator [Actinomycetes bacterium]|jgi:CarD family transcriptional regulator